MRLMRRLLRTLPIKAVRAQAPVNFRALLYYYHHRRYLKIYPAKRPYSSRIDYWFLSRHRLRGQRFRDKEMGGRLRGEKL